MKILLLIACILLGCFTLYHLGVAFLGWFCGDAGKVIIGHIIKGFAGAILFQSASDALNEYNK